MTGMEILATTEVAIEFGFCWSECGCAVIDVIP